MTETANDTAPEDPSGPDSEPTRQAAWTPSTDAQPPERPGTAETGRQAVAPEPSEGSSADAVATTPPGERIAKAMARAGVASRRDAEAMVLAGRVSVNGETLTSPARNVTDDDRILVDGAPLPLRERSRLWIFHKPRGVVTTAKDPEGRQTVFDVLPDDLPRVVAVGRLDINTEGLLLLTNDGGLAKVIAHPDTGWLRRYRVRAHGDTDQAQLDKLARGVTIDGMEYGPVEATLDRVQGDNVWLTLGLREGKNREVKRILEHLGLSVNRLIRLSFGPFQLGDLEVGLVEEVRTRVLKDQLGKTLAAEAGVDFESPVREPISPFGGSKAASRDTKAAEGATADRRNAARPAPPARVATGGAGSGPRKSAWRDETADKPRGTRIPRRGANPRDAQATAAERGRERVKSIRTGERRVVVERLSATPVEAAPEVKPRRRYADDGPAERQPRGARGRPDRAAGPGDSPGFKPRGARPGQDGARGFAGPRATSRHDERNASNGGRAERRSGAGSDDGAPRGRSGARPQSSDASGAGKARGPRPGGKPGGFSGARAGNDSGKPSGKSFGKPFGKAPGRSSDRPPGKAPNRSPGANSRPGGRSGGGGRDRTGPGGNRPPRGAR
jgi:23S rRNA pseudouridine2605 synthase